MENAKTIGSVELKIAQRIKNDQRILCWLLYILMKIDYKETGKQCAAISTGLVLGALAQLLLDPQKIRLLSLILTIVGALGWYVAAQFFFTHKSKKNGELENDPI